MENTVSERIVDAFQRAMKTPEFIKLANELEIYKEEVMSYPALGEAVARQYQTNKSIFERAGLTKK